MADISLIWLIWWNWLINWDRRFTTWHTSLLTQGLKVEIQIRHFTDQIHRYLVGIQWPSSDQPIIYPIPIAKLRCSISAYETYQPFSLMALMRWSTADALDRWRPITARENRSADQLSSADSIDPFIFNAFIYLEPVQRRIGTEYWSPKKVHPITLLDGRFKD